ncbi:MAG: hypothetical protein K2G30_02940, partial [Muribaculaceae bacterium]|nr:hypothetical protein [Muribaculaceae bacterium]
MAFSNTDTTARKLRKALPFILVVIAGAVMLATFQRNRRTENEAVDEGRCLPDTLRVATLYSPSSY